MMSMNNGEEKAKSKFKTNLQCQEIETNSDGGRFRVNAKGVFIKTDSEKWGKLKKFKGFRQN